MHTCSQWKVNSDSEARGPLTESPPLTIALCSVFLGNLLPQFGLWPNPLRKRESNFIAPHSDSKQIVSISKWSDAASGSYFLWRLGWGQFGWWHRARKNKIRLSRKIWNGLQGDRSNEMLRSGAGCFLERFKKERRTRWPCVKFKRINSDLRKPGRLAPAQYSLREGTKPKIIHKIYLSFLFLPLIRFFYWKFFMVGSLSTFPLPCQVYLPKTNRPLCSIILASGNND